MKHYGIPEWVDFTRGLLPETDAAAMRSHLAAGCAGCRELEDFCSTLADICRGMAGCEVPEWVVRNARAICPARKIENPKRALRIPAQLIYDSFLLPAPAGLRATWQVGWQALYRAGDYSLDLRVEPEIHSSRATVIGQIANHTIPGNRMEGIAVCLKAGRLVVAETRSNEFGEFQMEYEQQQQSRLQLYVYLENGDKRFQVSLKKFAAERASGIERGGCLPPGESPARRSNRIGKQAVIEK
jgi:hypothetical protein